MEMIFIVSLTSITGWKVIGVDNVQLRLSKLTEQSERENCHVATLLLDLEPDLAPSPSNNWDEIQAQLLCGNVGYLFYVTWHHPFDGLRYDLVNVGRYLHRPLMPVLKNIIKPGGFILYHTFMVPSMGKPRRPRFLLNNGELLEIFSGFRVVFFKEGQYSDGRPAQFLCAQKPS